MTTQLWHSSEFLKTEADILEIRDLRKSRAHPKFRPHPHSPQTFAQRFNRLAGCRLKPCAARVEMAKNIGAHFA